jgi:hypothetical protein
MVGHFSALATELEALQHIEYEHKIVLLPRQIVFIFWGTVIGTA